MTERGPKDIKPSKKIWKTTDVGTKLQMWNLSTEDHGQRIDIWAERESKIVGNWYLL